VYASADSPDTQHKLMLRKNGGLRNDKEEKASSCCYMHALFLYTSNARRKVRIDIEFYFHATLREVS
jgi:hypothetical protein